MRRGSGTRLQATLVFLGVVEGHDFLNVFVKLPGLSHVIMFISVPGIWWRS